MTNTIVEPRQRAPYVEFNVYGKDMNRHLPDDKTRYDNLKATKAMLLADHAEAMEYLGMLITELTAYESSETEDVLYGVNFLPRSEAIRRAQQSLWQANLKIKTIEAQIARIPTLSDTGSDTTQGS